MTLSPIQTAISRCLSTPRQQEDGSHICDLVFPADFIGFEGHFPANPVVPAVCLVSAVELCARQCARRPGLRLREIHLAKFRFPVLPDQPVQIKARTTQEECSGCLRITAELCQEQHPSSLVTLILAEQ